MQPSKPINDQKNLEMSENDITMDFSRGLDNVRYANLKKDILNQLTSKAIMEQLENLNEMYLLANQWLTTDMKSHPRRLAMTFMMTCDKQETPKPNTHMIKPLLAI